MTTSPPSSLVGWQDIATAPRDGSTFIGTGLNYGRGPERHLSLVYFDEARGGFFDRAGSDDLYAYLTHWTPCSIPSLATLRPDPSS